MAAGGGWSREWVHLYRYKYIVVARPLTQKEQLTFKEKYKKGKGIRLIRPVCWPTTVSASTKGFKATLKPVVSMSSAVSVIGGERAAQAPRKQRQATTILFIKILWAVKQQYERGVVATEYEPR